jgi:microsomal epoxide hydrolase
LHISLSDCKFFDFLLKLISVVALLTILQLFGPQSGDSGRSRLGKPSGKPQGYSYFPFEISPTPISWVKETGNFVHVSSHEKGGHFAAMERPEDLWADVEGFVKEAWGKKDGSKI